MTIRITLAVLFVAFLLSFGTSSCQSTAPVEEEEAVVTNGDKLSYQEPHRPQYHFSPPAKWMNDPNGMVYYAGEYHLFYQYYPDSTVWGPMHWGHAISTDLVHWEQLPIALYPDSLGYIFSGSAVVDWQNTSGLGTTGQPPLIALFTHHDPVGAEQGRDDFQYQSIAYSNDRGRSWTKYAGNPVIPNTKPIRDFRDPKVIWDDDSGQWVMVFAAKDRVQLWGSPNLIDWEYLSDWGAEYGEHGGVWECPDLFPMRVAETNEQKWVLLQSLNPGGPNGGSATQYFVGDFDGKFFHLDPNFKTDVSVGKAVWLDYGRDNYAGVTWSDVPTSNGRRLFMGWMSNWAYATVVPTEAWRSAMTLPRSLRLHQTATGYRLRSTPIQELQSLRLDTLPLADIAWGKPIDLTEGTTVAPSQWEVEIAVELRAEHTDFGISIANARGQQYRLGYQAKDQQYYTDRRQAGNHDFSDQFATALHRAPRQIDSDTVRLHFFVDRASCELFADDGRTVMTDIFFPDEDFNELQLYLDSGKAQILRAVVYPLAGIWGGNKWTAQQ